MTTKDGLIRNAMDPVASGKNWFDIKIAKLEEKVEAHEKKLKKYKQLAKLRREKIRNLKKENADYCRVIEEQRDILYGPATDS